MRFSYEIVRVRAAGSGVLLNGRNQNLLDVERHRAYLTSKFHNCSVMGNLLQLGRFVFVHSYSDKVASKHC